MHEPAAMNHAGRVLAVAKADFSDIADSFANAGFEVRLPGRGILQISSSAPTQKRLRLLLSVGVHGDETAPIEMLAHVLQELAGSPHALQADLMVVVGNPAAIAQGRRYLDADLNRLFTAERGALRSAAEAERADAIMRATAAFFSGGVGDKWHLDLHTAIRKSHYPTFAVVPDVIGGRAKANLAAWLGGAGIGAIILNSKLAPTYSAYSATQFGATSCTVELGQIGLLGSNDLGQFEATSAALDTLLRSGHTLAFRNVMPDVFDVAQEIVKRSDEFHLTFDRATENFTPLQPGALIATDGTISYHVGAATEYVVFPNPEVRIGQRAGLMVVRRTREAAA